MKTDKEFNEFAKNKIVENAKDGDLESINLCIKYGFDTNNYFKDQLVAFVNGNESIISEEESMVKVLKILFVNTKQKEQIGYIERISLND